MSKGCLPKKNHPEGDIGTCGREGGKIIPFFAFISKGHRAFINSPLEKC